MHLPSLPRSRPTPWRARVGPDPALPHYVRRRYHVCARADFVAQCWNAQEIPLYTGEFGYELMLQVPLAYALFRRGRLKKTTGLKGTRALYYFSPHHTEVSGMRSCQLYPGLNRVPYPADGRFYKLFWQPPPYKEHYQNSLFTFQKPLVIVHNKYNHEWAGPPVNFVSLAGLREMFRRLGGTYQIIYIRLEQKDLLDHQALEPFEDKEMIQGEFPGILLFEQITERYPDKGFNEIQFMIHAHCERYVSVQGGNAAIASWFGGTNLILARQGREIQSRAYELLYPRFSDAKIRSFNTESDLLAEIHSL